MKNLNVFENLRFNNESTLFALKRDNNFKSIIGDIYQSFGELYNRRKMC